MITTAIFVLFLGLIVFGPRKTIEMAQSLGLAVGKVKRATADFQTQLHQEVSTNHRVEDDAPEADRVEPAE